MPSAPTTLSRAAAEARVLLLSPAMRAMRHVCPCIAAFAVVVLASPAFADAPTPRAMKLSEAVAWAKAHQPQIVAARARVQAAKADAEVPKSQWFPSLGAAAELVVSTTNNTTSTPVGTGGVLDLARVGATPTVRTGSFKPSPSTLVGVGIGQELFDFGRIGAQTRALEAGVEVEKQSAAQTDVDIRYQVETAYFSVLAAKSVLASAEAAYQRSLTHRNFASAQVNSGLRAPVELTRAEADLQRFEALRVKASGGLAAAQAELAAAVGVTDAALDAAPETSATIAGAPTLDAALKDAEQRSPIVLEAMARVREQELTTKAIRAEARPNLWLTGTLTSRGGGATPSTGDATVGGGWAPSVPNWDAGLVFSWRVFDATIGARADASHAREQVRRAELDSVQQRAAADVQSAYVAVQVAQQALPALERARQAADANYAQVDARFQQGLATGVELADAEALRTDAEIQLALGQFEVQRARSALGRVIGEDVWTKR